MSATESPSLPAPDKPCDAIPYAVVIPAYRPSAALLETLGTLAERGVPAVVAVDDGSGPEYGAVFARAAEFARVSVLRHAVNLGKGAALKTGINFALCAFPGLRGIVTADADGQHDPADIERVASALMAQPEALILGRRAFGPHAPLRSRFGNLVTRGAMRALLGRGISDTQTGLRGIPAVLLPRLLRLESTGYEFELEMLLAAHRFGARIVEQPIRAIYEPGNSSSHFNPVFDSVKIYFILLRYASVSVLTALIDNLVFYVAYRRSGHILGSQVLGRACAVAFNYAMLRSAVFYSQQRHRQLLPRYLGLVLASGSVSYAGIRTLNALAGLTPVAAKILVETVLFFVNFTVVRLFVFHTRGEDPAQGPAA
ncbi:MAG: bifunctional glycosyltransferase family 2/GtrA family protein [Bryobacteraceae bacterium]|jgi:glycosyltransferase involved in cell wall biosynthesis